jgi:Gluconate 2-dehydrogenase subunit 3
MGVHPQALPGPALSRRSLLQRGLLGGSLLAVGGLGVLALRGGRTVPLPPEGLRIFSPREYAVLDAVARRLVRPRAGWPTVDEMGVALAADRIAERTEPSAQKELKQLLGLFENGLAGFLFGGRTRPFTALDGEEQDRVLGEWRDSGLAIRRTGFSALRTLVLAAYYKSPRVWPALGYPGLPAGFHRPEAEEWRGGDAPRPDGNGVWHGGPLR